MPGASSESGRKSGLWVRWESAPGVVATEFAIAPKAAGVIAGNVCLQARGIGYQRVNVPWIAHPAAVVNGTASDMEVTC
jgi:hypothetical protein